VNGAKICGMKKKPNNNLETTKKDLKYKLEMKTRSKLRIGI